MQQQSPFELNNPEMPTKDKPHIPNYTKGTIRLKYVVDALFTGCTIFFTINKYIHLIAYATMAEALVAGSRMAFRARLLLLLVSNLVWR